MKEEFKQASPMIFGILFGGVLLFMSTIALIFIPFYLAILGYLIALAVPFLIFYFGSRQTILCTDEGFSVEKQSRHKGTTKGFHPWSSVTKTHYFEIHDKDVDNRSSTQRYFQVECGGVSAMKVSRISRFAELIRIFNQQTPHLPYTWEPRTGFSVNFGKGLRAERDAYAQVSRPATPAKSGMLPPPIPGSTPAAEPRPQSGPPPLPNS